MNEMHLADFIRYDEKFIFATKGQIIDFCSVRGGKRV
jgi:hypothetical protein